MSDANARTDTSRDAQSTLVDLARRMSAARKFKMASAMSRTVRELAEAGVRGRHPDADEDGIRRRLAAVLLPREIAIDVFGSDPDTDSY